MSQESCGVYRRGDDSTALVCSPDPIGYGAGGQSPSWSPDGTQIHYLQTRDPHLPVMMVVDVAPGDPFRAGRSAPFIDPWPVLSTTPLRSHDVLADGSFVAASDYGQTDAVEGAMSEIRNDRMPFRVGQIHVVQNFFEELKARVPN